MRIKTSDFPKLGKRNYAAVREHFDSVRPWQSKYNPDNERPIGSRACKLTCDGDGFLSNRRIDAEDRIGARFNKAMRMLADGSIAFRLYDHDCVVYHPDDSITIHGYASVSTNDFITALTPMGISHTCRGRGRDDAFEPVLHLHPMTTHVSPASQWWPERRWRGPDWQRGMVINCERPVTLNYSAKTRHFVPSDVDALEPFYVPKVDRRASRQVSREYRLAKLAALLDAIVVLASLPQQTSERSWAGGGVRYGVLMDALREERWLDAVREMPRGERILRHRRYGTPNGITPGFLQQLRNHIYEHEGVVSRVEMPILTPQQYERYKQAQSRYDA